MTTTSKPYPWPRTIVRGTDHAWTLRRVDAAGTPWVPSEARAQIRPYHGGPLWLECGITIDPAEGWVTVSIPAADTEGPEWDRRMNGVWDLEAVTNGNKHRWVEGPIEVSQDVTRDAP